MNVVILINDQHAHDVLGCAGFPRLQTPAIDGLARDGIRFTQAVCANPPCLPSRHSLFHGLPSYQTGIYTNEHCLPIDRIPKVTMGRAFQQAGYVTGALGKMHWFPYCAGVPRGNHFGFDHRAGHFHETGESMETHFVKEHRDRRVRRDQETAAHGINPQWGDDSAAAFKGFTSSLTNAETVEWWIAQQSVKFIESYGAKPFLMVSSLPAPHAPHAVPADYAGMYDPRQIELPDPPPDGLPDANAYPRFKGLTREGLQEAIANYLAYVSACDACHAQVIQKLKDTGQYDDTLIIFLADHGELLGSRGLSAFSKYNLYERAIRFPLIIKPPKSYAGAWAGTVNHNLVSMVDVLPTVLDFANLPGQDLLPGISLKPCFTNGTLARTRPVTVTELMHGGDKIQLSIRSADWKYIDGHFGAELYHLRDDPHEFKNLAGRPESAGPLAELKSLGLEEMRQAAYSAGKRCLDYPPATFDVQEM